MTARSLRRYPAVGAVVAALALGAGGVAAQQRTPRIWDIPLGTHVRDLPAAEFLDPACGTKGGPAGLPLGGFAQFETCPPEADGLREIWFIYDDTLEYVGLARREPTTRSATMVLDQPVILSFLIDGRGLVLGYRVYTDPRAAPELRLSAYEIAHHFKARFGLEGSCVDLPPAEGEHPIDGLYVKEVCRKDEEGSRTVAESRYFYKPGQQLLDPHTNRPMVNEFESWARLEVRQTGPLPETARRAAPPPAAGPPDATDRRALFLAGRTKDCPRCDLAAADLRRRDLAGADLAGANLEGALLHRAILRAADLTGARLRGANLNRAQLGLARLGGAELAAAMLFKAEAGRADFAGADLAGALMGKADLTFARLEGANLDDADLGEARLNDANLAKATLNGAYLPLAAMFRANLRGVVAEGATLAEASLRGADLGGAVLRGADLYGADLAGADLSRADFAAARLLSANLAEANRTDAVFTGALMPDNTVHR